MNQPIRDVLSLLQQRPLTAAALQQRLGLSQPVISRRLRYLRDNGYVRIVGYEPAGERVASQRMPPLYGPGSGPDEPYPRVCIKEPSFCVRRLLARLEPLGVFTGLMVR